MKLQQNASLVNCAEFFFFSNLLHTMTTEKFFFYPDGPTLDWFRCPKIFFFSLSWNGLAFFLLLRISRRTLHINASFFQNWFFGFERNSSCQPFSIVWLAFFASLVKSLINQLFLNWSEKFLLGASTWPDLNLGAQNVKNTACLPTFKGF